jgi:UDP-N-acetylglucosamine:LPS N-acetylglucosamine transferase
VRVVLACSSGGHLVQLYQLKPWWSDHERLWVTFRTPDAMSLLKGEAIEYAYHPTTRNIPNFVRNLGVAWRLLRRYRPDVVVSDGAGVALPFFLIARGLRIRTIYIEVLDRIDTPTLTGRLCHPLSDLFLLQWLEQKAAYPRGVLIGPLL